MNFKPTFHFLLFATILSFFTCSQDDAGSTPNIIVLFCDDLGYGDLGVYGHPSIQTPNLDKMAAEGMKFTNFYSGSPACTASRYALLTGQYPVRSGFGWVLNPNSAKGIHPEERTIAEAMKEAGYATACFGKWHLGSTKQEYLPLQNGFDEFAGFPYSNDMIPPLHGKIAYLEGNDTLDMNFDQTNLTKDATERAVHFIQKNKENPFFLYVPYSMPHVPLNPGASFAGNSKRGKYGDVIEELDWSTGQIFEAVQKAGLAENTLIVFTSDNGPWIIKDQAGGSSGLLRDGKGSTWEGGMRVPGLAYWKGKISAGAVCNEPASTLDLFPTLLELTGLSKTETQHVDGKSLSSYLFQNEIPETEKPYFYYGPGNRLQAVRKGDWKLHIRTNSQTGKEYFDKKLPLLFHLNHDPSEKYELSEAHPEVVKDLLKEVEEHQLQLEQEPNFFQRDKLDRKIDHLGVGKTIQFKFAPNEKYDFPNGLTDGFTEPNFEYQKLPGFQGNDLDAILDLDEIRKVGNVEIGFLQNPTNWIFLPENVHFETSKDGVNWTAYSNINHSIPTEKSQLRYAFQTTELANTEFRYLKIFAKNIEKCPEWHEAKGQPSWLFPDEIIIYE